MPKPHHEIFKTEKRVGMSFSNVMWIFDKPGGRRTVTKIEWTRGRPGSLQNAFFRKHSGVWCAIQYDSKMYWDSGEEKISLQLLQDAAELIKICRWW